MLFCFKLLPRASASAPLGERLTCKPRKLFPPQVDFYHRNKIQTREQRFHHREWHSLLREAVGVVSLSKVRLPLKEVPCLRNSRLWQKLSLQVSKTSKHQKRKDMINTGFIFAVFLGLMTVLRAPERRSYSVLGLFFIPSY